eukprot:UN00323
MGDHLQVLVFRAQKKQIDYILSYNNKCLLCEKRGYFGVD